MFWVLRNQMLQSCLNNCLEINLLLMTFFCIYNAERFLGTEEWGDWQVHLLRSKRWLWKTAWGGAEGLLSDFMSHSTTPPTVIFFLPTSQLFRVSWDSPSGCFQGFFSHQKLLSMATWFCQGQMWAGEMEFGNKRTYCKWFTQEPLSSKLKLFFSGEDGGYLMLCGSCLTQGLDHLRV